MSWEFGHGFNDRENEREYRFWRQIKSSGAVRKVMGFIIEGKRGIGSYKRHDNSWCDREWLEDNECEVDEVRDCSK